MKTMGVCARCGEPFTSTSANAALCPDCLRNGTRLIREERLRREPTVAQQIGHVFGVAALVVGCAASLLIFTGWIWNGIQALRLLLGGG